MNAGGAEYLATYVRELRAQNPQHARRVGGRPHRRQPAAVGALPRRADDRGHEHDRPRPHRGRQPRVRRGRDGAQRMQNGGCHPVDGCTGRRRASRARTSSSSPPTSSTRPRASRSSPPTRSRRFGGVKVGFIGMTLEGTPNIVAAGRHPGLQVPRRGRDRQPLRPSCKRAGRQGDRGAAAPGRRPDAPFNTTRTTAARASPARSSTSSSRTSRTSTCSSRATPTSPTTASIDGEPVTSAASSGRLLTDIDLEARPRTRDDVESLTRVRQTFAEGRAPEADVRRWSTTMRGCGATAPDAGAARSRPTSEARHADDSGENPAATSSPTRNSPTPTTPTAAAPRSR